jgi:hypothetical protein
VSTLNVYVMSDDVVSVPIAGVVVSMVDPANHYSLMARVSSDANGLAGFDVPAGNYELRLFKREVIFGNPLRVSVVGGSAVTATGTLTTLPVATDPRLCRCTGRFLGLSGYPLGGVTVVFTQKAEPEKAMPRVMDSQLVIQSDIVMRTNAEGYLTLDLMRRGEYLASFSGEDETWGLVVPDRASANLIDLIYPQPVSLTWDPTLAPSNAVTVQVGQSITVPVSLLFSNYETINNGATDPWLLFMNSDETIAPAALVNGGMLITGAVAGAVQISASIRSGLTPNRVPDYSLSSTPLSVTVTP